MKQAYSYIRFSSVKQELGDSVRRQEKRAVEYAARHNLSLDTRSYRDLGISAFKGLNATHGNLSKFLIAVNTGIIQKGSYLLVENFDRLSRAHVDEALELFLSIIRQGIIVVTLDDNKVYSQDSIKHDRGISLIISILSMSRANEESATKSQRVHEAWEGKRERGEILTAMAPSWLKLSADRKQWIVLKEKAAIVHKIYQLAMDGNGTPSIARILNQEKIPTMKSALHWTFGTVAAILKNEAVFGLYTPKKAVGAAPIPGYYPSIVSETEFKLVQDGMKKRQWIGGRSSHYVNNLFAGISYCYQCGSKMRVAGHSGRHLYLRCLNAYSNNGCKEGRFPYLAAEIAILRYIADDLSVLMSTDTEVADPTVTLNAERNDIERRLKKLVLIAEESEESLTLSTRISALEKQLRGVNQKLKAISSVPNRDIDPDEMNQLFDKLKGLDGDIARELRLKIQEHLRRMIKRVDFWCDADHDRPSVALKFFEQFGGSYQALDVGKYR